MATVLTVHSSRLIRRKQNVALQCMLQHFPFLNNKNDEEKVKKAKAPELGFST